MIAVIIQGVSAIAAAAILCATPVIWLNAAAKDWAAELLERVAALFTAGAETLHDHAMAQRAADRVYEAVLQEKQRARIEAASASVAPCDEAAGESSAPAALREVA